MGVGLTERAVRCLRELRQLDRDTRDVTSTISRAGDMMRVAAGRDDIPCSAFLPAGDAPELQAYLGWTEAVSYPEVLQALVDFPGGLLPMRNVGSSQMILIAKTMREIAVRELAFAAFGSRRPFRCDIRAAFSGQTGR